MHQHDAAQSERQASEDMRAEAEETPRPRNAGGPQPAAHTLDHSRAGDGGVVARSRHTVVLSAEERERLGYELRRRGWNIRDLAARTGTSRHTVTRLLDGKKPTYVSSLRRVLVALAAEPPMPGSEVIFTPPPATSSAA